LISPNAPPSRLFLVGFMGAGKTTVGTILAEKLGYDFVDLDQAIEAVAGKSVREIFLEDGEAAFRALEHSAIESFRALERCVVALGGGAFVSPVNRAHLSEIGVTVWLDCRIDVCMERLGADPGRPLLRGYDEMVELLNQRRPSYELADFVVPSGDQSPDAIADAIIQLVLPGSRR
jgi:shikimate kinase